MARSPFMSFNVSPGLIGRQMKNLKPEKRSRDIPDGDGSRAKDRALKNKQLEQRNAPASENTSGLQDVAGALAVKAHGRKKR